MMVAREAMNVMGSRIQCIVVSFKSQVKFDACAVQCITDLEVLLVPVPFRAMLVWNLWTLSERRFNKDEVLVLSRAMRFQ